MAKENINDENKSPQTRAAALHKRELVSGYHESIVATDKAVFVLESEGAK